MSSIKKGSIMKTMYMIIFILNIFIGCSYKNVRVIDDEANHIVNGNKMYMCGKGKKEGKVGGRAHYSKHYNDKDGKPRKSVDIAVETFKFSLMASNTNNNNEPRYKDIPDWTFLERIENIYTNFAYEIYVNKDKKELALVFKGTEFTDLRDILIGNIVGIHYIEGEQRLNKILESEKYKQYKTIILVGHSLGGGIAKFVSRNSSKRVKKIIIFSHPPWFLNVFIFPAWLLYPQKTIIEYKLKKPFAVTEDNEFLDIKREDNLEVYCQNNGIFKEHEIYDLSRCLLMISAKKDEDARSVLRDIGCDDY